MSWKPWFSNWTIKIKIEILDYFHNKGKGSKNPTLEHARQKNGKQLHKSTLHRWTKSERDNRKSSDGCRCYACDLNLSTREWNYSEMEMLLAAQNRYMSQSDARVIAWTVIEDAKEFLKPKFLSEVQLKFSDRWFVRFQNDNHFMCENWTARKRFCRKQTSKIQLRPSRTVILMPVLFRKVHQMTQHMVTLLWKLSQIEMRFILPSGTQTSALLTMLMLHCVMLRVNT